MLHLIHSMLEFEQFFSVSNLSRDFTSFLHLHQDILVGIITMCSQTAAISDMLFLRSSRKQVQKLRLMLTYTSKSFKKVFKAYFIWTFYN